MEVGAFSLKEVVKIVGCNPHFIRDLLRKKGSGPHFEPFFRSYTGGIRDEFSIRDVYNIAVLACLTKCFIGRYYFKKIVSELNLVSLEKLPYTTLEIETADGTGKISVHIGAVLRGLSWK